MANEVVSDISTKGGLNRAERSQHRSPSGGNGFRFRVMQCLYQLVLWRPTPLLDILSQKNGELALLSGSFNNSNPRHLPRESVFDECC